MTTAPPQADERREQRNVAEWRAADGDGPGVAVGYASMFDRSYMVGGMFVERVAPGAFTRSIANDDVVALIDHDASKLLGRTEAGTLELVEDRTGLLYRVELPDTTLGRDVAVSLARGDLRGSSFGFFVESDDWEETDSGEPLRTINRASLRDVGPVTFPASPHATAGLAGRAGDGLPGPLARFAEARSIDPADVAEAVDAREFGRLLRPRPPRRRVIG